VQRPDGEDDSDGDQSPDESNMTAFEREVARRKREFERGQTSEMSGQMVKAKNDKKNRKKQQPL